MTIRFAGSAALAIAVATAQLAFADAAPPPRVHFAGCVKPGVEAGCLIVESDGKTYNVTSAKSSLKVGQFAAGTGTPGGMSICQQGVGLTNITLDNPLPPHADCAKDTHPSASH